MSKCHILFTHEQPDDEFWCEHKDQQCGRTYHAQHIERFLEKLLVLAGWTLELYGRHQYLRDRTSQKEDNSRHCRNTSVQASSAGVKIVLDHQNVDTKLQRYD